LALGHDLQLGTQYGQHSEQLARTKFSPSATLKTRQRLRCDARQSCDSPLLYAQPLAPLSNGRPEFLYGLHLIFIAIKFNLWRIFDLKINFFKTFLSEFFLLHHPQLRTHSLQIIDVAPVAPTSKSALR
jgi:hypothetical protein